ncbi:hypothetical protein Tco_0318057 [Tanacetum coccineum]
MHIRNDPSFFLTNKTGAPQGEELGLIKPLSDSSFSCSDILLSFQQGRLIDKAPSFERCQTRYNRFGFLLVESEEGPQQVPQEKTSGLHFTKVSGKCYSRTTAVPVLLHPLPIVVAVVAILFASRDAPTAGGHLGQSLPEVGTLVTRCGGCDGFWGGGCCGPGVDLVNDVDCLHLPHSGSSYCARPPEGPCCPVVRNPCPCCACDPVHLLILPTCPCRLSPAPAKRGQPVPVVELTCSL